MSATVSKLSSLPILGKECTLLAGEEGLGNIVRYVTVMEAPDFNIQTLTDSVFVLTTLSSYYTSTESINKIITALCEQNVSAICIKLGRFIEEVDESTIEIARKYHTPLFTVTKNVLFREVISEILTAIIFEQQSTISEPNALNEDLLSAILHNRDMKQILLLLTDKIPCNCCCLNHRGEILATNSTDETEIDKEIIDQLLLRIQKSKKKNYVSFRDHFIFPCAAHGQIVGYLVVCDTHKIVKSRFIFISQVVSFLAIKFLEEYLRIEAEQRMTARILDEILFVDQPDETVIAEKLQLLGITPKDLHIVMLLSVRDKKNKIQADSYLDYWVNWLRYKYDQVVVFIKGSDLVILISYSKKKKVDFAKLAQQMRKEVCQGALEDLDIGFSLPADDLRKLPQCYSQAIRAVDYGRAVESENHIYPYQNYVGIGLVSHGVISGDGEVIRATIIDPIQQYDERCNTKLWSSLEACLEEDSLDLAAKKLCIHISTLRYRLQKIEQLTNVNFFIPKGRQALYIAYILNISYRA
ncbi:PucR family transcriptional regulator ligand-binding domain-containing protein [uncultured Cohaesibacter sp.]|uniref:PucR family transcriptional regulator n=1 Tax=uncultured Cohaesibacter sp. TaxID=1002546 RepID=UPI0029315611|nr:PucR family transcriptional regulator ligand-binding domain-containing protein [uncultured Cohaesibacter sp.]